MVIYLEGPGLAAGRPVQATLEQKDQRFSPEVLAVPIGSTVSFPNLDPIFHNVFSLSKAKLFDLGYYPKGRTRSVTFDRAGVVQVYCHLHPNMSAAILVTPSAFYTRPGRDGSFTLSEALEGNHKVVVWHKSAGFFQRTIYVPEAGTVELSLQIPIREDRQP